MKNIRVIIFTIAWVVLFANSVAQDRTVAREWNEALLTAIRNDFARPTVHARNLWHHSIAMYDIYSVYTGKGKPYMLGNELIEFSCDFEGLPETGDSEEFISEAISYASYKLLKHRFAISPGKDISFSSIDGLMDQMGYDKDIISEDYSDGSAAGFGNYVAGCIIENGLGDGSHESFDYANIHYEPVNPVMVPTSPGPQGITDPNHWQPLGFDFFIDQAGFEVPGGVPDFLSPEWGKVTSFALSEKDLTVYERDGFEYYVFHDPGPPPYYDDSSPEANEPYRWNHSLVSLWSTDHDQDETNLIDISPNNVGGLTLEDFPTTFEEYKEFYKFPDAGTLRKGYALNPATGQPYLPQLVPKTDYSRVLAEFWADGPDSETPPGHWYTILNYVSDHPQMVKKFKGQGEVLSDLEWDIKSYFTLGGAVHDAAVSAWGIKGWYDYVRPISAIRYMASLGQASDPNDLSYHPGGLLLEPDYIELVREGDPLAGNINEHVGKIKLYSWKGPEYIFDPETDAADVGWILADNWWPYQRPSFVTPPFAGYVSGHSTFSRAAAEVLTLLTGNEYFPGGMGEFHAPKNQFLVFEEGPTQDITLQWAKYYDASDQCSLSRIWGGIHPPADDIPGRIIGSKIGIDAFNLAEDYFDRSVITNTNKPTSEKINIYPNPVRMGSTLILDINDNNTYEFNLYSSTGKLLNNDIIRGNSRIEFSTENLQAGIYFLKMKSNNIEYQSKVIIN